MQLSIRYLSCLLQILACIACQVPINLYAQQNANDPAAITRQTVDEVMNDMRMNESVYASDRAILNAMVEQRLLPRFNFNVMTQLAVGRSWSQATPEQKSSLQNEFRTLLVRTYSNVLFTSRNETATIKSSNTTPQGDVTIAMEVSHATGEPVALAFRMRKDNADWKVIDFAVNGASLVVNYRTSFSSEISKSGIDGLIKSLAEKNRNNSE